MSTSDQHVQDFSTENALLGQLSQKPDTTHTISVENFTNQLDMSIVQRDLDAIKREYSDIDKLTTVQMRGYQGDPNAHFVFLAKLTQESSSKPYCFPVKLADNNTRTLDWDILLDENYQNQLLKNFCFFQGSMNDESPTTVMRCLKHSTCNAVREEIAMRGLVAVYSSVLAIQKERKQKRQKVVDMEQPPKIKLTYFPDFKNLSFTNCVSLVLQDQEADDAYYFSVKTPMLAKKSYNLPFMGVLGEKIVFAYDSEFLMQPRNFDVEPTYFGGSRMHVEANRTVCNSQMAIGKLDTRQFDVSPLDEKMFCFLNIALSGDYPRLFELLCVLTLAQGGNVCFMDETPPDCANLLFKRFFFERNNISPTFVESLKATVAKYVGRLDYVFKAKHGELISFTPTTVHMTNFNTNFALVRSDLTISGDFEMENLAQLKQFFLRVIQFDGKLSEFSFDTLTADTFKIKCSIIGLSDEHVKQIYVDESPFFNYLTFE